MDKDELDAEAKDEISGTYYDEFMAEKCNCDRKDKDCLKCKGVADNETIMALEDLIAGCEW